MNRNPDFEGLLGNWLETGPTAAPDGVLDSVLVEFPSTPQRRVASRAPWTSPLMNGYVRVLAAIAAVALIAVAGVVVLDTAPSNGVAGPPLASPAPSVASTSASASASPSASLSARAVDTSGWKSFTSPRHGITLRYPAEWTVDPATAPWPVGAVIADPPNPMVDTLASPSGFSIAVASQPLPNGLTGAAWLARRQAANAALDPDYAYCYPAPAEMERTVVDGMPAWLQGGNGCAVNEVFTFAGGRVYVITGNIDPHLNRPLFDAVLSTVLFDPAKANDAPVARPSSSPSPKPS